MKDQKTPQQLPIGRQLLDKAYQAHLTAQKSGMLVGGFSLVAADLAERHHIDPCTGESRHGQRAAFPL